MQQELTTWLSEPLAIRPEWMAGFNMDQRTPQAAKGGAASGGSIAVLSIRGPLTNREGILTQEYGYVSYEWITKTIDSLVGDPGIKAIVLDFESPGGSAMGATEAADKIRAAAKQKTIVSISNGWMASAAYFIGAQASEVVVSPSAQIGSIGVYTYHFDFSKAHESMGVKVTMVSAGRYKVEGNEFAPLDNEAKQRMQDVVDAYYTQFVDAVAKGRGVRSETVRNGFGQGRMLMADEAIKERMADRVATLDQVITGLARRSAKSLANERALRIAEVS